MTITLLQGDCLELMRTLPAGSVDAVVTDPPYMFGAASVSGGNNAKISRFGDLMNQSYFYREIINICKEVVKPDGCLWMFSNWRGFPVMMKGAVEADCGVESVLVWDKCWIGPGGMRGLRPSYEIVLLIPFGEFALPNRGLPDIWRHQWASHKPHHPAEKPVNLLKQLVTETPGDTVLDPFMGSGTTGVACVQTGRNFIGMELDPTYFAIAEKRIRDAQQQMALPMEV